jgi:hypothetical protein
MGGSGMSRSFKIVLIGAIAAIVVGSAVFAAVVRSYGVRAEVQAAYAIWNDEQIVMFITVSEVGSSTAVLQQLTSSAARAIGQSYQPRYASFGKSTATILIFENGTFRSTTHPVDDPVIGFVPRPNFIAGRPLVVGGFWNGREVERMETSDYLRLVAGRVVDEPRGWHTRSLLRRGAFDLPIRVHGEEVTLKSSLIGTQASIALVRPGSAPERVFDLTLSSRAVGAREFGIIFGKAPRRTSSPR